jgi:hypothetical protein
MAPGSSEYRLLTDTRLSPQAVVLGLRIASLGDGEHEIDGDGFAAMLHGYPGRTAIAGYVRELRLTGYVARVRNGGHGRGAVYVWRGDNPVRLDEQDTTKGKPVRYAERDIAAASDPVRDCEPDAESRSDARTGTSPVVEEGGGVNPLVSPLSEIAPDAEKALRVEAVKFNGSGVHLRDYLARKVRPQEQYGFVKVVSMWLDGFNFSWRDAAGNLIPRTHWTELIGAAVVEMTATNEAQRKFAAGDPVNLKNKLEILCREWGDAGRRSRSSAGGKRGAPDVEDSGGVGGGASGLPAQPGVAKRGGRFVRTNRDAPRG